LIELVGP